MNKTEGVQYLTEGFSSTRMYKERAMEALAIAKEMEEQKKTIPVWVDANTTKFMDMEKIKRKKLEIIRVKIGRGELVWMEKSTAIKNGFISE